MVSRILTIDCPLGIHLRPAGAMADEAIKYTCKIEFVYKATKVANAKSVLSILAAGVKCGDDIEVRCEGDDEETALEAVCTALMESLES